MIKLIINGAVTVEVKRFPCNIGRDVDNDVVIDNDSVSGTHCRLEKSHHGFTLVDLGSTNKIVHEGRIHKEIDILSKPAEVSLGNVNIVFDTNIDKLEMTREIDLSQYYFGPLAYIKHHWHSITIAALFLLSTMGALFFIDYNTKKSAYLVLPLVLVVGGLTLSFIIALMAKTISGRFHIVRTVKTTFSFIIIIALLRWYGLVDTYLWGRQFRTVVEEFFKFSFFLSMVLIYGRIIFSRFDRRGTAITLSLIYICTYGLLSVANSTIDKVSFDFKAPAAPMWISFSKESRGSDILFAKMDDSFDEVDEHVKKLTLDEK